MLALLPLIFALLQPAPAAEGTVHFQRGVSFFESGDFTAALAEFQEAYRFFHRYEYLMNIGITHQKLFHYPEALETFERYLVAGGAKISKQRRADVKKEIDKLRVLLAEVIVIVEGAPAEIEVDGHPIGKTPLAKAVLLGPGTHHVRASREGAEAEEPLDVVSGMKKVLRLVPRAQAIQVAGLKTKRIFAELEDGRVVAIGGGKEIGAFSAFERPVANPPAITAASTPDAPTPAPASPWYRRWPIWTAVGVIVVGGSVAAVAATR